MLIAVGVCTQGSGQPPSTAVSTGLVNDIATRRSLRQWPVRLRVTEGTGVERSLLNQDVKDTVTIVLCYLSLL